MTTSPGFVRTEGNLYKMPGTVHHALQMLDREDFTLPLKWVGFPNEPSSLFFLNPWTYYSFCLEPSFSTSSALSMDVPFFKKFLWLSRSRLDASTNEKFFWLQIITKPK